VYIYVHVSIALQAIIIIIHVVNPLYDNYKMTSITS